MNSHPTLQLDPQLHRFHIDFDPSSETHFSFPNGNTVLVDGYFAMILVDIRTEDQNAAFPSQPLNWFDSEQNPIEQPKNFLVHHGRTRLAIVDINLAEKETTYSFTISVAVGTEVYTSPDPTIINKEEPPING